MVKNSASAALENIENGAWKNVRGVWRLVFGSFPEEQRSIEWHDFQLDQPLDWAKSFHEDSLEICLNFRGTGQFGGKKSAVVLDPGMASFYTTTSERLSALRENHAMHRFLTLEVTPEFLERELAGLMDGLLPEVRDFCLHRRKSLPALAIRKIPVHLLALRSQLLEPPVSRAALPVWFQSKTTEVFASLLFREDAPTELFCKRHHRQNRERCERVFHLLERDMENPPSLEMLAAEVGCSPFYLSRIFTEQFGMGIPAALRKIRISKAAERLLQEKSTITEIAISVGYSSLGAFNKAFLDEHGVAPGTYRKTRHR